jgi:hypothetical protein
MRGRLPSGPTFVDRLDGSPVAKERLKVLLETLAGTCRIGEACARLGIQESRFEQVRIGVLQAALAAAEQRRAGRRPRPRGPRDAEVQQLRQRVAELEAQLQTALLRAEVAVLLPQVGDATQKKTATTASPPRQRPKRPQRPRKRS